MTQDVRTLRRPVAEYHDVTGRDGEEFAFYGTGIGHATSFRTGHAHPTHFTSAADPELARTLLRCESALAEQTEAVATSAEAGVTAAPVRSATAVTVAKLTEYLRKLRAAAAADSSPDALAQAHRYAERGQRCSACRWFECGIYAVEHEYATDDVCTCGASPGGVFDDAHEHTDACGAVPARARYAVVTYGLTLVPGELTKRRVTWTDSAFEVIEVLTQRNRQGAFLPATSARALAQAAPWDAALRDAYVNRAVA